MSSVWDYLNDHASAGHCAYSHYHNSHSASTCPASAGVCEVIRYLVGELKMAESRQAPPGPLVTNPTQSFDPLRDTPPGGWQQPVEKR